MKRLTRYISILLSLVLLLSLVPISASAKSSKLIALTFDDGPSYANTPTLLAGLKERGVHVSFFMTGQNAKANPELVKQAWKDGHQICSHTYNHAELTALSDRDIKEQLSKTDKILDDAIGYDLKYQLRPPYGAYSDRVLKAANVPCYYWSVDTRDWESRNADAAYREFMRAARDGSIVLMHDLYSTTVTAALRAVDTLLAEGYEFVTLNELLVRRGRAPEAGVIRFSAYPDDHGTDPALSKPVIDCEDTSKGRQVVITGDERAKIYYTTNGKNPTPGNSKLYKGPFSVADETKVKAICVYDWNGFVSKVTSKLIVYPGLGAPTLSIDNGMLKIGGLPKGTSYYYTTDGSVPTESSTKYKSSFEAKPNTVYTVRGYTPGYNNGGWTWITYSASGRTYTDMSPDCWYYTDADRAVGKGLLEINGTELSAYSPVTRSQLVTMLYRLAGSPEVGSGNMPFIDLEKKSGYIDAVVWAFDTGITRGTGEGRFEPTERVTRQQVCSMIARYLRSVGIEDTDGGQSASRFSDYAQVAPGFRADVDTMCHLGILRGYGDGTLRPQSSITRAEIATVLLRVEAITGSSE